MRRHESPPLPKSYKAMWSDEAIEQRALEYRGVPPEEAERRAKEIVAAKVEREARLAEKEKASTASVADAKADRALFRRVVQDERFRGLSGWAAKVLMVIVVDGRDDWVRVRYPAFSTKVGASRATVKRALAECVESGALRRWYGRSRASQKSWAKYRLTMGLTGETAKTHHGAHP